MTAPDALAAFAEGLRLYDDYATSHAPPKHIVLALVEVAKAARDDTGAEPSASILARALDRLDAALKEQG